MSKFILDSSAIVAVIKKEPGAHIVQPTIPCAIMSSVNVMEAVRVLQRHNFSYDTAASTLSLLIGEVISFDRQQSYQAASFEPIARQYGFSLGDCVCLALAREKQLPVLTADTAWKNAESHLNLDIRLIR